MIFITVGTQAPFDRLIKCVDDWIQITGYDCFAQIGQSNYIPKHIKYKQFLNEQEFNEIFKNASIIISHTGMGTIISSLQSKKLLLTLPRLAKFNEHRNDHQLATAKAFSEKGYIYSIFNEEDLLYYLDKLESLSHLKSIDDKADNNILQFLRSI